jgi:hypothetical protein
MNIFIHIPKTAGTFLGYLFDHGSGRRVMWDYSADYSTARIPEPAVVAHADFISSWFWGIQGHFFYEKYAHVFPHARFMTCIRHPVHRLVSQYKHELYDAIQSRATGATPDGDWKKQALLGGGGLLEWFNLDPSVGNAQVNHLAGRALDDYDFVFVQEMLVPCFGLFCKQFAFERKDPLIGTFPSINAAEDRKFSSPEKKRQFEMLAQVPQEQLDRLFQMIPEEVSLYRRGLQLVSSRL